MGHVPCWRSLVMVLSTENGDGDSDGEVDNAVSTAHTLKGDLKFL